MRCGSNYRHCASLPQSVPQLPVAAFLRLRIVIVGCCHSLPRVRARADNRAQATQGGCTPATNGRMLMPPPAGPNNDGVSANIKAICARFFARRRLDALVRCRCLDELEIFGLAW